MAWCAISASKIYGICYYESIQNTNNYLEMLKTFFWPKHLRTSEYKKYYFQQDGAGSHRSDIVQNWGKDKFGKKFINKYMWPPRSPDLNPCDFFLWRYLKDKVYSPLPKTLDDLKKNLEREIKKINKNILKKVFENFEKRLKKIIEVNGDIIEDLQ